MVQRVLKFVKYLHHFGWQPTVLTVRKPDYETVDPGLLKEVSESVSIIRTSTFEPSRVFKFLMSWLGRFRSTLLGKRTPAGQDLNPEPKLPLSTRISVFIFMPDNRIGWLPFATLAVLRKLRKEKFDAILSTSPPFSVQLVGLAAKWIMKKPWVVDLRDLWVLNPHKTPPTGLHLQISRYVERKVLRFADQVVTVSEPLREDLRKGYPEITPEKFQVIPNGYDADDFKIKVAAGHDRRLVIGHVGSLSMSSGRTPFHFLLALSRLVQEVPGFKQEARVVFVGEIDGENRRIIDRMRSDLQLGDMIACVGGVSHRKAISYMREFDLLLFIIGGSLEGCPSSRGCVSGKLYEYLAAGKPILALAEEGPIRELIEESRCGAFVDRRDVEKIKKAIFEFNRKFKQGALRTDANWDYIRNFERRRLTGRLANTLNQLSAESSR